MNYAQTEGRASLEEMTTTEIKKKLIEVMEERLGIHFAFGWLLQAYLQPCGEEIDRIVAIKQLERYGA